MGSVKRRFGAVDLEATELMITAFKSICPRCLYGSRAKSAFRLGGVLIFDDALLAKHAVYTLSSSDLPVKISKTPKMQHSSHEALIFNPPSLP